MFGKKKKKTTFKAKTAKQIKAQKPIKQEKAKTTEPKKITKPKTASKLKPIKHDDKFEQGIGLDKPIIIKGNATKSKPVSRKELKRVARMGGFTAWDGRTGKTFETEKEAKDYAADLTKKTGEVITVSRTDRQVTHTYKAEQRSK